MGAVPIITRLASGARSRGDVPPLAVGLGRFVRSPSPLRRHGRVLPVLVAASIAFGFAPTAVAYHNPAGPLIARGGDPGNGWVALTFASDGSPVSGELLGYFRKLKLPAVFAVYSYRGDGSFGGGTRLTFEPPGSLGTKVYVDANVADQNIHYEVYDEFDSNSYGGMGIQVTGLKGVLTLLLVASSDTTHWTWSLEGGPGVQLLAVATGERAIWAVERDFRGPANVQAWVRGVGGHVIVDASAPFEVKQTWVGGYLSQLFGLPTADRLELSTPVGERQCSCSFYDLVGPNRAGPGSYTARLTGAGPSSVFVWGADARLPEPGTLLSFTDGTAASVRAGSPVALVARLTDADAAPVAEGEVTFALSGPDGPLTATASTGEEGLAADTLAAPSNPGFYQVSASYPGRPEGPGPAHTSYMLEVTA